MELGIDFWRFETLIFWNFYSPMSLAGRTLLKKNPAFYALHTTKVLLALFNYFIDIVLTSPFSIRSKFYS